MDSATQNWSDRGSTPHTHTPRSPRSAALRPWPSPGRLIEGNRADMQLLDLVNGANGEGAVVGQCQAGKKGLGLD